MEIGPAGVGKSQAALEAARELGLDIVEIAPQPTEEEIELFTALLISFICEDEGEEED